MRDTMSEQDKQALESEVKILFEQCKVDSRGSGERVDAILRKSRYELGLSEGFKLCGKIAWAMGALLTGPSKGRKQQGINDE
ncbi:MAG: hypothetical protein ACPG4U_09320 [Pseudomonadales bacterium]